MALERRIIANIHRAVDAQDFVQVDKQRQFLGLLDRAKRQGLIDYDDSPLVEISLSPTELALFGQFSAHPNEVLARNTLAQAASISERALPQRISILRKKLDPSLGQIQPKRGQGYVLVRQS